MARHDWDTRFSTFLKQCGAVTIKYEKGRRRFTGISGIVFNRCTPRSEGSWSAVPRAFQNAENKADGNMPIMFVAQAANGTETDDQFVIMRMRTFRPLLTQLLTDHPERYLQERR